jgi:heat shock protein HslJ
MRATRRAVVLLAVCACSGGRAATVIPLPGTSWVLEEVGGVPVVQRGRATLAFAESGRASGNGSCNRFSGTATIAGDSLSFGPLLSTKMACVEDALTNQETRYLASLGSAQRYAIAGDTLRIYVAGGGELRFARATP